MNKLSLALCFPAAAGSSATVFPGKLLFSALSDLPTPDGQPQPPGAVGAPAFLCHHPWRAVANRISSFSLTPKK